MGNVILVKGFQHLSSIKMFSNEFNLMDVQKWKDGEKEKETKYK